MAAGLPKQFKCVEIAQKTALQFVSALFPQIIRRQPVPVPLMAQRELVRRSVVRRQRSQSFFSR